MGFLNQIAGLIDFLEWWSIPILFLLLALLSYFRISIFSRAWKKSLRESFSNQAGRKSIIKRKEQYTGRNYFAQYKRIMKNGLAFFGRVFGEEIHHPRTLEVCWTIALVYPIVFFLLQVVFTGNATLGGIPIFEPIGPLGVRWVAMALLVLLVILIVVTLLVDRIKYIGRKKLILIGYIATFGFISVALTSAGLIFFFLVSFFAIAATVVEVITIFLLVIVANVILGTTNSITTVVFVGALAFVGGFAFSYIYRNINRWVESKESYLKWKWLLLIGYVSLSVVISFVVIPLLDNVDDLTKTYLFFLYALPLINAITDTLSVIASRYLITKGLAGGRIRMFVCLAVDIVAAIVILIVMFALIQLTAWLFVEYFSFTIFREGHNILNVFDDFWSLKGEYSWLKLMAITTVLITLGHLFIVLWHSALFVSPSREKGFENSWWEMQQEKPNKHEEYGMTQSQEEIIHHFTTMRETKTFMHLAIISAVVVGITKMFIF